MLLTLLQTRVTPVVFDGHDGGDNKRRSKRIKQEREERERRRQQVIAAYEHLVEGRPLVAEELVKEFVVAVPKGETLEARIDWDRLLDRIEVAERLYAAWVEMDDEDVLLLL